MWFAARTPGLYSGSASVPFPTISGLVGRWMADTGVTTSGGNVTQVLDQSGNGYTVTPNGVVPFNATSAYNSKPAFAWTDANDAALITATPSLPVVNLGAGNRLSVFIVGRMTTSTVNFGRAVSIGEGGSVDYGVPGNIAALTRAGTTAFIETYYNGGVPQIDTAMSTGANHRFGVVIDGTTATHYVDNVAGSTGAITLALTTPNNIVLGNAWTNGLTTGGSAWDGPTLEFIIYSAALTPTEWGSLDAYAVSRYGS